MSDRVCEICSVKVPPFGETLCPIHRDTVVLKIFKKLGGVVAKDQKLH